MVCRRSDWFPWDRAMTLHASKVEPSRLGTNTEKRLQIQIQ